ncbi:MAG: DUF1592 domain-containing protein [Myxococcales bacterium]|nr:DUF1592 domain-containing protein [Myxococcales bacterium]
MTSQTASHLPRALALLLVMTSAGACYQGGREGETDDGLSGASSGASTTAGDDTDGGDTDTGSDTVGDYDFKPAPSSLRLLLARHYTNAVRDLLGDAAAAVVEPPEDSAINGFEAVAAAQLALSDAAVQAYEDSARAAAAASIANPGKLATYLGCTPIGPEDAACHEQFIRAFGRMAFRRPLTEEEVALYLDVAQTTALDAGDFMVGIEYAVASFLQSPFFLYQVELGVPDKDDPTIHRLTGYELASRLSFFLLDTTPDANLLDAAEAGVLDSAEGVRNAAEFMLTRPEAQVALSNFYAELLRLRELDSLPKDPLVFAEWSPALAAAFREETVRTIEDIVWQQDGDIRDMLDTPFTFANKTLADFYGLAHPSGGQFGDAFLKVPLPDAHKRGGIFGQGSFLSLFAHISSTSPTLRGKFVREVLMCEAIPAPPPGVMTNLPPLGQDTPTMRDRLELHMSDEGCAICHKLMDPIGFGLENYDGIGRFRTVENGVEINTQSEVDGVGAFDGARQLGQVLRGEPEVSMCMVRNLFRHGTGHIETKGEVGPLAEVDADFIDDGYRMQAMIIDLVASESFRSVGEPN